MNNVEIFITIHRIHIPSQINKAVLSLIVTQRLLDNASLN